MRLFGDDRCHLWSEIRRKDEDKEFNLVIILIPVMCDLKRKKSPSQPRKPCGATVAILHNMT